MENNNECIDIDELKEKYVQFKDKYGLPEFTELNELFDIEELNVETEFFLRKIRKIVSDRVAGYLRFLEVILNLSNAPMFFFKLIKKLESKDREELSVIYEQLGNLEIELIKLDLDYKEKSEAEFIKKVFNFFLGIRTDILNVVNKMANGVNDGKKEERSYFG